MNAHAKINPFLSVGLLREDGYHSIRTIFQAIGLHDIITLTESDELRLECSVPELNGPDNLAWKAVRLLSEIVDPPNVLIRIEKNIPLQAGLAGGSTDAAAVLLALDEWVGRLISEEDRNAIALACGSDAPFFVHRQARMRAECRGERLRPLDATIQQWLVIAKPNIGTSTANAYAALDELPNREFRDFPQDSAMHNDFELVADSESLKLIKRMKSLGASGAHLCGSGSAVFGLFDEQNAHQVAEQLTNDGHWAVATYTLTEIEGPEWTR